MNLDNAFALRCYNQSRWSRECRRSEKHTPCAEQTRQKKTRRRRSELAPLATAMRKRNCEAAFKKFKFKFPPSTFWAGRWSSGLSKGPIRDLNISALSPLQNVTTLSLCQHHKPILLTSTFGLLLTQSGVSVRTQLVPPLPTESDLPTNNPPSLSLFPSATYPPRSHQMMYCLRTYIPLLLLPLPLSLSPIHLTTLLVLTYILNRPCIYCSFLLLILFGSSCAWQGGRCFWSVDAGTFFSGGIKNGIDAANTSMSMSTLNAADGDGGLSWALYFLPRLYHSSAQPHSQTHTPSPSENPIPAFLAEITNHTLSGLAAAVKETGAAILGEAKRKIVGSGSISTEIVETDAVLRNSISSLGLETGNGIGTQWLKSLLGRSEWTLPCVGVKVVI
jgi:Bladder cancer-related protein BC10